ncbi:MAG: Asp-tRNA(Asn)/Glu-tRNA(Gln) amidotransferase subunit GatB [Patescibacteria group bacterium]
MLNKKYHPVIGLEVHIELSTKSKMFCSCPANHFGAPPNSQTCPVCLGLPGALPFVNREALMKTVRFALAFDCDVNLFSKFDRKHYFYPDLAKGYQISQYDLPLSRNGNFILASNQIRVRRIHLEEDTAKIVHQRLGGKRVSLIDFNRSGVPLLEMVTEPDFRDAASVVSFLKEVQLIARYLEISAADMEKGSMRLEANVSLSADDEIPDYKVELKNINSFKFLAKALTAEITRQEQILERGERVVQETRGYDEVRGTTFPQRTKEEAQDYRYFPEPDIPPIRFSQEEVRKLKEGLTELPQKARERLTKTLGVRPEYVEILVNERNRLAYFEEAVAIAKKHNLSVSQLVDLVINKNLDRDYPEPGGLVRKILELTQKEYAPYKVVEEKVLGVLAANTKAVADYHKGKGQVIGYLIGMVQKELKGKGDPKVIKEVLLLKLEQASKM